MDKVVALIPARGGSKGIPRKNIKLFRGKPLLVWSIEYANRCIGIDCVYVSTEDDEIASISRSYGAQVIYRPMELAQDLSPDLGVFQHALEYLGRVPAYLVHLRPTCPIRPWNLVDEMLFDLGVLGGADSIRTVVESPHPPAKFWLRDGEYIKPLLHLPDIPEAYNMPRQMLPEVLWHVGCVDAVRGDVVAGGSMSGKKVLPYTIPRKYAIDLDTPEDWTYAEGLDL